MLHQYSKVSSKIIQKSSKKHQKNMHKIMHKSSTNHLKIKITVVRLDPAGGKWTTEQTRNCRIIFAIIWGIILGIIFGIILVPF